MRIASDRTLISAEKTARLLRLKDAGADKDAEIYESLPVDISTSRGLGPAPIQVVATE